MSGLRFLGPSRGAVREPLGVRGGEYFLAWGGGGGPVSGRGPAPTDGGEETGGEETDSLRCTWWGPRSPRRSPRGKGKDGAGDYKEGVVRDPVEGCRTLIGRPVDVTDGPPDPTPDRDPRVRRAPGDVRDPYCTSHGKGWVPGYLDLQCRGWGRVEVPLRPGETSG